MLERTALLDIQSFAGQSPPDLSPHADLYLLSPEIKSRWNYGPNRAQVQQLLHGMVCPVSACA